MNPIPSYLAGDALALPAPTELTKIFRIAEISAYKWVADTEKDATLINAGELRQMIDAAANADAITFHFGHYFNAVPSDVISLLHYCLEWAECPVYVSSPEEIAFLAIRADLPITETLDWLKEAGTTQILGFLPPGIVDSPYYADMDELLLDDRHQILTDCSDRGIQWNYPFQPGNLEFEDEFVDCHSFMQAHPEAEIILQPNPLIDTESIFDYENGQALAHAFGIQVTLPIYRINCTSTFFRNGIDFFSLEGTISHTTQTLSEDS